MNPPENPNPMCICIATPIAQKIAVNTALYTHRIGPTKINENTTGSSIPVKAATAATPPRNAAVFLRLALGAAKIIAAQAHVNPPQYIGK